MDPNQIKSSLLNSIAEFIENSTIEFNYFQNLIEIKRKKRKKNYRISVYYGNVFDRDFS